MKIIQPYARIMMSESAQASRLSLEQWGEQVLRFVEWCGRISHRSEDAQTGDSYKRILKSIVFDKGDWSIAEHAPVSVDCVVDRGITHEIVRHRIGAYTQESTRFVNYQKKMAPSFVCPFSLIWPNGWDFCLDSQVSRTHYDGIPSHVFIRDPLDIPRYNEWARTIGECELGYQRLIESGCAPQIARSVFPNALASRIIITFNLRQWRLFFLMRTSAQAHPQMREVMIPLLAEFKRAFPILYDDIEPNATQIENLRRGR